MHHLQLVCEGHVLRLKVLKANCTNVCSCLANCVRSVTKTKVDKNVTRSVKSGTEQKNTGGQGELLHISSLVQAVTSTNQYWCLLAQWAKTLR